MYLVLGSVPSPGGTWSGDVPGLGGVPSPGGWTWSGGCTWSWGAPGLGGVCT